MIPASSFPIVFLIAYLVAVGWHGAYMLAFLGSAVEMSRVPKKVRKEWERQLEPLMKDFNEAETEEEQQKAAKKIVDWIEQPVVYMEYPRFENIRRELWWVEVHLAFPACNIAWALDASNWWDYLLVTVNVYLNYQWWKHHNHDDRWKKRRKKAASKIKAINGKLVVVPVPVKT